MAEIDSLMQQEFRRVVDWPPGIPLMKNPAAYQKVVLYQLCHHYNLQLQDLPPPEQGDPPPPFHAFFPLLAAPCNICEAAQALSEMCMRSAISSD